MSDDVIQFRYQMPPYENDVKGIAEYYDQESRRRFGEALFDWVKDHNGGIVGPIHERIEQQNDWLFASGVYKTVTLYCKVTGLPEPPEFMLMGGPADKMIVRTGGTAVWRVPMAPPMPTVVAYGEDPTRIVERYAEYERIGTTGAYRFLAVRER